MILLPEHQAEIEQAIADGEDDPPKMKLYAYENWRRGLVEELHRWVSIF